MTDCMVFVSRFAPACVCLTSISELSDFVWFLSYGPNPVCVYFLVIQTV